MTLVVADELRKGNRLALSRVLSQVEAGSPAGERALDKLFPFTGKAHKIGITGPPGSGKSTLVNAFARAFRALPHHPRVAIIAVDPTSPFSGGAILGDRVRMLDLQQDTGVFIRSMATRGALGGLSNRTEALSQVFDSAGYAYILIETVGAGQSEVDIVNLAHTTIVVDTPGMGDDIQSIKAGILEIADILVINKADRPGADQSVRYLQNMIEMGYRSNIQRAGKHALLDVSGDPQTDLPQGWLPPVIKTVATEFEGVEAVLQAILRHGSFLRESDLWRAKDEKALRDTMRKMILSGLVDTWREQVSTVLIEEHIRAVVERNESPGAAVRALLSYNQNVKPFSSE